MTVRIAAATLIALAALVFAAPGAGPSETEAVFPGENGRISFVVNGAIGGFGIHTMKPNGTDSEPVEGTWQPDGPAWGAPEWSPDGTEIAYFPANEGSLLGIGIAAVDGSGVRLVPNTTVGSSPTWSPDGSMLAFSDLADGGIDIFTIATDGSSKTRITNTPGESEWYLDWSPDGQRIAFATGGSETQWDIIVVDVDGSNRRNLTDTPGVSERHPSWSPAGENLVFERYSSGNPREIARVDADGQNYTILGEGEEPAYSPDGEKIVFSEAIGISVMDADGGNRSVLKEVWAGLPDWGTRPVTTPTEFIWGDNNCSGRVDPVDALLTLRYENGLPTNTGDCPDMGEAVDIVAASEHPWGDVDCSGSIDPVDSLKLLRSDAGLSVTQAEGCPPIGSELELADSWAGIGAS